MAGEMLDQIHGTDFFNEAMNADELYNLAYTELYGGGSAP